MRPNGNAEVVLGHLATFPLDSVLPMGADGKHYLAPEDLWPTRGRTGLGLDDLLDLYTFASIVSPIVELDKQLGHDFRKIQEVVDTPGFMIAASHARELVMSPRESERSVHILFFLLFQLAGRPVLTRGLLRKIAELRMPGVTPKQQAKLLDLCECLAKENPVEQQGFIAPLSPEFLARVSLRSRV